MTEPAFDCPRFQKCSVNNCPLYSGYPDMPSSPDDPERKCKVGKTIRLRVAAKHPSVLRYGGLTTREWAATQQWNNAEATSGNAVSREKSSFVSAIQTKVGAKV